MFLGSIRTFQAELEADIVIFVIFRQSGATSTQKIDIISAHLIVSFTIKVDN